MPDTFEQLGTSFATVYDSFLARVSDDMYMELTELDTYEMLQDLLINALPRFEFPKVDIFDYEKLYEELDILYKRPKHLHAMANYELEKIFSYLYCILSNPFWQGERLPPPTISLGQKGPADAGPLFYLPPKLIV